MSPEVSVVIPAYNRQDTIGRAIASVRAQTWQDFEIVIVDDGSTDGTAAVAERFADARIRVIRHERNCGASAARNTGIAAARGDYIAFLDSDDEWLPQKLENQLDRLREQPAGTNVSCTGVVLHLIDRGIRRDYVLAECADWRRKITLGCDERPGTTLLARREVFEQVGPLDEALPRFEDWDWLLRYAAIGGQIVILPAPLANVYNIRGRLGHLTEQSALRLLAKHAALFSALSPADRRRSLCDLWLQIASTYALEARLCDASRMVLRGLRQRPIHGAVRLAGYAIEFVRLRARGPHLLFLPSKDAQRKP